LRDTITQLWDARRAFSLSRAHISFFLSLALASHTSSHSPRDTLFRIIHTRNTMCVFISDLPPIIFRTRSSQLAWRTRHGTLTRAEI
jgi:hypothetical protein